MAKSVTLIATTNVNLSKAADLILERLKRNEGNLTKNGVLECLAKAIAGKRSSWGGVVRNEMLLGEGVFFDRCKSLVMSGEADPELESKGPFAAAPSGSDLMYVIEDMEVFSDDVRGLVIGFELMNGTREGTFEDGDPFYGLFRPILSAGGGRELLKNADLTLSEGEFLRSLLRCGVVKQNWPEAVREALTLWVALRFPTDDYDDATEKLFKIHECLVANRKIERALFKGNVEQH